MSCFCPFSHVGLGVTSSSSSSPTNWLNNICSHHLHTCVRCATPTTLTWRRIGLRIMRYDAVRFVTVYVLRAWAIVQLFVLPKNGVRMCLTSFSHVHRASQRCSQRSCAFVSASALSPIRLVRAQNETARIFPLLRIFQFRFSYCTHRVYKVKYAQLKLLNIWHFVHNGFCFSSVIKSLCFKKHGHFISLD